MNALDFLANPDFWAMGGYAAYVWPSYGLALLVLILNVVAVWHSK